MTEARPQSAVIGHITECDDLSEDGGALWQAEIQTLGGYGVAATIYAGTHDAAQRMAEQAIAAWSNLASASPDADLVERVARAIAPVIQKPLNVVATAAIEALTVTAPPSDSDAPFADALRTLERHYYSDEELAQWLGAPQPLLDGQTPLQLLAAGRKAEIFACVQRLDDGVYP
jgi:hypothetical protein